MTVSSAEEAKVNWWLRWPGLFSAELAAFERRLATVSVTRQSQGLLILDVGWPRGGQIIRLKVGFSPMHPFCRPAVTAPELRFARHQNPMGNSLCLLTDASGEWDPGQKVADLIAEQLEQIFAANEARDEGRFDDAAAVEEQAPDPLATYYDFLAQPGSGIFFNSDQPLPRGQVGFAEFAVQSRQFPKNAFTAVLRKVTPGSGSWLGRRFEVPGLAPDQIINGRWVRVRPPVTKDVNELLSAAEQAIDQATTLQPKLRERLRAVGNAENAITALLFDDELDYTTRRKGVGCLFIASNNRPSEPRRVSLIRGYRIAADLNTRVPISAALNRKKVFLIGVGAIGSFVAIELARAGVGEIVLLDYDVVEPGNSVRWPLGQTAWGVSKVLALQEFIRRNYPATQVEVAIGRVGETTTEAPEDTSVDGNPVVFIRREIVNADLVVDTSASTECQHAIAFHCRDLATPYVAGYATEGAAGGVVARFPADSLACFVCLQSHWNDEGSPTPPIDADGVVVPIGCNKPTFTGASFDLQEVSLQVTRSAVGLLSGEAHSSGDWQVAVLGLRDGDRRSLPSWRSAPLSPRCSECVGR